MSQLESFRQIHTFLFDIDGVMTNNEILVLENGDLLRKMNIRDGLAIKHAIREGYRIGFITGGKSEGVKKRLQDLGVKDVYLGFQDKLEAYESFIAAYRADEGGILYMGDDLPDYPVMRRVGLPACPSDAIPEILAIAQYISPFAGGDGCVRDVIEKVLKLHGNWIK